MDNERIPTFKEARTDVKGKYLVLAVFALGILAAALLAALILL